MIADGHTKRIWWVNGQVTEDMPPCRALPVKVSLKGLKTRGPMIDAEPVEEEGLDIVVARVPRPRRPRTSVRARPAALPRTHRAPSRETQAFLDGEDLPDEDIAILRELEAETRITHKDIAGERELALISEAQEGMRVDALLAWPIDDRRLRQISAAGRRAADTLLTAHDNLIRMYASRYARMASARHGADFDDLLQEARRGFLHGIKKFSATAGVKLTTYAAIWMLQCMGRTLDRTRSLVVLPFNVVERAKRIMKKGAPITADALIAAGKNTLNPEIAEAGAAVWSGRDISVHETVGGQASDDDDNGSLKIAGYLQSDEDVAENVVQADLAARRASLVHAALAELGANEQEVARRRLMTDPPDTLEEIGRDLGMTRENARLIEVKVKSKLAAFLLAQARANDVNAEVLGNPDELEIAVEVNEAA